MDTELARTFLAVIADGSFVNAAQRLHVTQSTVSSRIQRLEEQLGAELFVRNKMGTTLTPAGRQFQRYAAVLARTVQQARQEIGIVSGFRGTLTVGGRIGLWDDLLLRWLPIYSKLAPDIAVRALIGFESDLMDALLEGRADIGVMYTPQARPGLELAPVVQDVVHGDPVTLGHELWRQHGPDVPGPAGDQHVLHALSILWRRLRQANGGRPLGIVYPAVAASRWNISTVSRE